MEAIGPQPNRPSAEELLAVRLKKALATKAEWAAYLAQLGDGQAKDVIRYTFRTRNKDFKPKSKKRKNYKKTYRKKNYKKRSYYKKSFYRRPSYRGYRRRYRY